MIFFMYEQSLLDYSWTILVRSYVPTFWMISISKRLHQSCRVPTAVNLCSNYYFWIPGSPTSYTWHRAFCSGTHLEWNFIWLIFDVITLTYAPSSQLRYLWANVGFYGWCIHCRTASLDLWSCHMSTIKRFNVRYMR